MEILFEDTSICRVSYASHVHCTHAISRRSGTVEINRAEEGHKHKQLELATFVTFDPNAKDIDVDGALSSDTEGVSRKIHEQAQTTPGDQNDELEGSRARAPEPVLSSNNPNVHNAPRGSSDCDAQENSGARADLTYQLLPKVEKYKQSLELAVQVGAVSLSLPASQPVYSKLTDLKMTGTGRSSPASFWTFALSGP
ncbi:hypothetical protein PM082_018207 [Marasmius tenuissimus]|nr:hypothetical protein PM082_018207 [Marasmius tenuissimus]